MVRIRIWVLHVLTKIEVEIRVCMHANGTISPAAV